MEAIGGLHFGPKFINGHLVKIAQGGSVQTRGSSNVGEGADILWDEKQRPNSTVRALFESRSLENALDHINISPALITRIASMSFTYRISNGNVESNLLCVLPGLNRK